MKRRIAAQMFQQRIAILRDIMVAGTFPETIGVPVVVGESGG